MIVIYKLVSSKMHKLARLRSACASALSNQSSMDALWIAKGTTFLRQAEIKDLSDYADCQSNLNLRCKHLPTCTSQLYGLGVGFLTINPLPHIDAF